METISNADGVLTPCSDSLLVEPAFWRLGSHIFFLPPDVAVNDKV